EKDKDSKAYDNKSGWKKAWICGGGVIFNLIFAVFVFYALVSFSGFKSEQALIFSGYNFPFGTQTDQISVINVGENSPAKAVGLKTGDAILTINGNDVLSYDNFSKTVLDNKGKEVVLGLKGGKEIAVTPRVEYPSSEGPLGLGLREVAVLTYPTVPEKIFVGFLHAYNITHYSLVAMGQLIYYSVANKSLETIAYSMTGPVGIYAITKLTVAKGLYDVLNLIAILSIALGVSNLLPIPAMDGAKLIYVGLESANRKVFSKDLLMRIETFGAFFLIALAIFIVFKDFIQFKDIIFK
ncbi:MAG: M50 family metallopeptidase, partial [Candidatus Pacebacteria bacterium]|nr:M50 family metallopeptidase [Candidatus Paceibacterota bacterium]